MRKRDGEREKEKEKESRPLSCDSCSVKRTSLNDIMLLSVCHAIVSTKNFTRLVPKIKRLRARDKQDLANHSSLSHVLSLLSSQTCSFCVRYPEFFVTFVV